MLLTEAVDALQKKVKKGKGVTKETMAERQDKVCMVYDASPLSRCSVRCSAIFTATHSAAHTAIHSQLRALGAVHNFKPIARHYLGQH